MAYLSPRMIEIMKAVDAAAFNGSAALDDVTRKAGYKRNRRLAVRSTLMCILRRSAVDNPAPSDRGLFIFRIPPRDQYDIEYWGLTDAGRNALREIAAMAA